MSERNPKIVTLIPFGSKDQSRLLIWQHVHDWLQKTLGYPIHTAEAYSTRQKVFNIGLARNLAALDAGDWDVAVIHDADTVLSPQQIKTGIKACLETGAITYPYTERWELDFTGTEMLLADESSDWQSHMTKYTRNQPLGGCVIIRRDLWDLVRGYDSDFIGWGHEDGAFAVACEILSGKKMQRVKGKSLHLEHTLSPVKNPENELYQKNRTRMDRYLKAMEQNHPQNRQTIKKLRDESISKDTKAGIKWPKDNRKKPVMETAVALMLLTDVTSVLDRFGCTHWLSDGTLLGAIREDGFISHDYDIDIGVWAEDFDIRVIPELVHKYGCYIVRLQGEPGKSMMITLRRTGIIFDMFFYYPLLKSHKKLKKKYGDRAVTYHSLYNAIEPKATSNKAERFDCIYPDFKPLIRRQFMGHEFWVPENSVKHLEAAYGKDWRIPNSDWEVFRDQPNLELQGIIDDIAAHSRLVTEYLKIELVPKQ
ncbi:LicD family protein [Candidatus Saccharibacteria bacterium]|nr:LicD family protein [Candidatus Saccharibacteria bacterium]